MKKTITVELTELEADKVRALIGLAAKEFEIKWLKDPNDYDSLEAMRFYDKLKEKFYI